MRLRPRECQWLMKVHTCGPMRDSFRLQQDSPEGDWRAEVLFEPQQAVDSYPFAHRQMQECDDKLSLYLPSLPTRKNRVAVVLRTAATSLLESDTHLGARYRHLRRQLPTFKAAVKAMARHLAVPIHRLLTHGEAWVDRGAAQFERQRLERELASLHSKARAKGFTLVPIAEAC